jgi:hypothetical protein
MLLAFRHRLQAAGPDGGASRGGIASARRGVVFGHLDFEAVTLATRRSGIEDFRNQGANPMAIRPKGS